MDTKEKERVPTLVEVWKDMSQESLKIGLSTLECLDSGMVVALKKYKEANPQHICMNDFQDVLGETSAPIAKEVLAMLTLRAKSASFNEWADSLMVKAGYPSGMLLKNDK